MGLKGLTSTKYALLRKSIFQVTTGKLMGTGITKLLTPPNLGNEDQKRVASLLTAVLLTLCLIAVVRLILTVMLLPGYLPTILRANGVLVAVIIVLFLIMRTGRVKTACILFTLYQWLAIAWLTYRYGGVNLSVYGFFIFVILSSGLLLGGKWSLGYALASVSYGLLLLYFEHIGVITPIAESPLNAFNMITPSFITTAALVYLYSREIAKALAQAGERTNQLESANLQLTEEMYTRKRLEKQLVQAQKMESMGTLAGGIAHDFNNILSAIIGYAELAKTSPSMDSDVPEFMDKILEAGYRAKDLVQRILTFSRQAEPELKPVSVKLIVEEALQLIRASFPSTIEIRRDLKSDTLVMGDSSQIHQVVMNLCTNAGHAMQEKGGTLEIGISDVFLDADFTDGYIALSPGYFVKLTVNDNGCGIPPDTLNRVFDPFFTTKEREGGTGLGLAMVQGIVENLNGSILAYSEPGKGSVFTIYLPATEKESSSEETTQEELPKGTERVLFVDDEPALIEIGRKILERLGYQVTTSMHPLSALEMFRADTSKFDLVVTDMTMPKMTGDMLARELISMRKDIPIILCTGFAFGLSKEQTKEIGISGFLLKPIIRSEIAKLVRKVLDEAKGGALMNPLGKEE